MRPHMTHRVYPLLLLATLSLIIRPLAVRAQASAPAQRPNFLFIYTDDQRWDALSCVQKEEGDKGRFPWFQTPNMDRIAAEGVRFRNAFVVNSLCASARSTFLTGRYSHENGVANNHTPMPLDSVNSATLLRDAGYTTAYFGKFHHDQAERTPRLRRHLFLRRPGPIPGLPLQH